MSQAIFTSFFNSEGNSISFVDFPYIEIIKPGITKFMGQKHYLATAEVDANHINFDAPYIEYETRENRANMQPIKNSVWFAKMKNSIKHIYASSVDDFLINDYIFSTGFCGIRCEEFAFEYLINYINLGYFEMMKNRLAHGATQESINIEDLKSLKIHLPSKSKLIEFHSVVGGIHCYISRIINETYELEQLKHNLLPLLINEQLV